MKKSLGIIIATTLAFSLVGCKQRTTETGNTSAGKSTYKDGTYDIKNKSEKGGFEQAIVIIKDGKIENIELKRLDDNSKEINYDEWSGQGTPNIKQAKQDMQKSMVEKQSTEVDGTSGATSTSNGWKKAVSDALEKASK